MRQKIVLIAICLFMISCNRKEFCTDTEEAMTGAIVRISAPDTLEVGKTVPIMIEVMAPDSFCVKRAECFIVETEHYYLQLGARIIHTGSKSNGCDCLEDAHARTIIYFTPEVRGNYIFGTRKPGLSSSTADSMNIEIIVN